MFSSHSHATKGSIVQLNISAGGVPKSSITEGIVEPSGLQGDRQRNLKYHGGPDRALCLWSLEIIQALQKEGHPIQPGDAGENITLSGLPWNRISPGCQMGLGDGVLLLVTDYAPPCRTIARYFKLRRYGRISQKQNPGTSRLYARVLIPGVLRVGDLVTLHNMTDFGAAGEG
ncbi:sulfurase [Methylomonas lenta]|uniref:Sulfurase n=1 Tax=Methylomonas lenta TaxID=980561 RepID=A0A177NF31_9GAMM|nr:MOSC domain-containing protein [Methylomonas lenta]OAI16442.1 sulfurase [Methylomonas lenta]